MVIYFLIESWKDSDILTEADKFHPEFDKEKKKKKVLPRKILDSSNRSPEPWL